MSTSPTQNHLFSEHSAAVPTANDFLFFSTTRSNKTLKQNHIKKFITDLFPSIVKASTTELKMPFW